MQKLFVKLHHDNCGMMVVCQQVCELMLQSMKRKQEATGTGKDDCLWQICKWSDAITMGQVFAELIDFRVIANQANTRQTFHIIDDNSTQQQFETLNQAPVVFQQFVNALNRIRIGDNIPDSIKNVLRLRSASEKQKYQKMTKILSENYQLYEVINLETLIENNDNDNS